MRKIKYTVIINKLNFTSYLFKKKTWSQMRRKNSSRDTILIKKVCTKITRLSK